MLALGEGQWWASLLVSLFFRRRVPLFRVLGASKGAAVEIWEAYLHSLR